jgi:hypothetical protein
MARLRDIFTYQAEVSGRRKLRTYVKVTLFVLAALIVFLAVALYQQAQERQVMAVTKPVVVVPTSTFTPQATVATEACPSDPSDWTMVDIFPDDVYKRIEPACVYDDLAHSVAWALAIQEGYSRQAAADALGFVNYPMAQMKQVTIAVNQQEPTPVDVNFVAPVPNFTEWYVNGAGEPAVSFAIRGCFRTFTIVGNEQQNWGEGYPVICDLFMDVEASNMLMCLDGHCFNSPYTPTMFSVLYGNAGNGSWIWLGTESNSFFTIDDTQVLLNNHAVTDLNGTVPWDAAWLTQTYQLNMQSLQENWQTLTSDADLQVIVSSINSYLAGGVNP